jgi:hypothetical protein
MNINGKLAPIMLTKSPPVQMRECSPWSVTRGRGPMRLISAGAHVVSKSDESAGKLLHRLLWNMRGTKAGNKPEKPSHLHGPYKCPRSQRFHEQLSPFVSNGGRGIRTPERVTPLAVFKTAAFNHSAIPPLPKYLISIVSGFPDCMFRARLQQLSCRP